MGVDSFLSACACRKSVHRLKSASIAARVFTYWVHLITFMAQPQDESSFVRHAYLALTVKARVADT